MPSLQKSRDVFIWRRRENNLFLTQLIRIPSIGITMYLIKFTVIYEESTKAQIPLVHSITELPPFRLLALLARQEIFSPTQLLNSPTDILSLSWSSPVGVKGTRVLFNSFPFHPYSSLSGHMGGLNRTKQELQLRRVCTVKIPWDSGDDGGGAHLLGFVWV